MNDTEDLTLEEINLIYEDARLRSREILKELGVYSAALVPPIHPKSNKLYRGEMPSNLHEASIGEITLYFSLITQFYSYVQALEAEAKEDKRLATEKLKAVKATVRSSLKGNKDTKDDKLTINAVYIVTNAEFLEKERTYNALSSLLGSVSKKYHYVSRLVTVEQLLTSDSMRSAKSVKATANYGNRLSRGKK